MPVPFSALPAGAGPVRPGSESDACGVAFVADLHGRATHEIVEQALTALHNLDHRGAAGAEPASGDGAGITVQVPDAFLRAVVDFDLPERGRYAVGIAFVPADARGRGAVARARRAGRRRRGADRPRLARGADRRPARSARPRAASCRRSGSCSWPVRTARPASTSNGAPSPRARSPSGARASTSCRCTSRRCRRAPWSTRACSRPTSSARSSPTCATSGSRARSRLVHSRFSTNTFPSWPLAHPYRYIAHNGEINTIRGNRNWMRTRETLLESDLSRRHASGCSRSARRTHQRLGDVRRGARAAAPRRPQPAARGADDDSGGVGEQPDMDAARREFYEFHSCLMEAWDGPACVNFTDGTVIGAVLDRNGLRPGRWWQTSDGLVVLGSESRRARPRPGRASWRRAGCSPAGCSSSTPRAARSARTTTSRPSSPPSTRTASGCTPA